VYEAGLSFLQKRGQGGKALMLNANRINLSRMRIENAKEDLLAAMENLSTGRYRTANNRAYYSMFHAIRALLALDGRDFKSHSQVLGYFNKAYIHTALMEHRFQKMIKAASKCRNSSDYEDYYRATSEETKGNVDGAEELLAAVERIVEARLEAEYDQE
jgi:uncharacterized protein (UPF0332 family)